MDFMKKKMYLKQIIISKLKIILDSFIIIILDWQVNIHCLMMESKKKFDLIWM